MSEAEELERLTRGLRRHLARRAWLGERRVEPAATVVAPGPPAQTATPNAQGPAAPAAPAASSPPPARADAPATTPRVAADPAAGPHRPGPWPSGWGDTPPRKDEAERRAAEVRARAAAAPDLEALQAEVAGCVACGLCATRTRTVFQDGTAPARVMFVGEAPGFHEDRQGVPFVGRAGALLTDIVEKGMGLRRDQVVIANVLKCRPPDNRDPRPVEKRICTGWLDRQIELVDPEVLIGLGRHAAGHLLGSEASMAQLRGRVWQRGGRKVVATYHPAFLLRSPQMKKECWQDIQLAMAELRLPPPGRAGSGRASGNPAGGGR